MPKLTFDQLVKKNKEKLNRFHKELNKAYIEYYTQDDKSVTGNTTGFLRSRFNVDTNPSSGTVPAKFQEEGDKPSIETRRKLKTRSEQRRNALINKLKNTTIGETIYHYNDAPHAYRHHELGFGETKTPPRPFFEGAVNNTQTYVEQIANRLISDQIKVRYK